MTVAVKNNNKTVDEYTPEQRREIDAELDEAEKGPFHGPFKSAAEMIAHIENELKPRTLSLSPP
ncbi:MAG TPA: hypothetical protein VNU44_23055 [Bryobacteraceae bacterium]|jgi:hypothetical protein|nr:hypothetical protein [Bryobacteraceae bacterium]